ncbi:hypothetical protein [Chryseobacterium sp. G0201]|uniref:hypothetical protein n=1 Tax=Chryseobacterium sp. G0201 TaxID=2487065 RepID=UPI000F509C2E|nr:hypothetical protein [Chryseobacterium sp. G0201]AZA52398.1 hypothetical protein EG348_04995 [Chryseobacterium sp. G0201]
MPLNNQDTQSITPLKARISELNAIIANLEILADVQATDTTANTILKTDARSLMISLTVAYANTAADYFDYKDSPLAKQLTTNKSKIKNMTGVDAKIYCNKLYSIVYENISQLNPDYVTTAEVQEWLTSINNFDAKAYDSGISIDTTQNVTQNLQAEFKKLNLCLKNMDRLMKKYDILDKSFHNNYKISRKIPDLGTRHNIETPKE